MNQRAASAPYWSRISVGSTVFFFDFDIFSTRPTVTGSPVSTMIPSLISSGDNPAAIGPLVGLVRHHALREQAGERLGHVDLADVLERPRPEARVEQVEDRMLDPADILADRQPLLGDRAIERLVRRAGWRSG